MALARLPQLVPPLHASTQSSLPRCSSVSRPSPLSSSHEPGWPKPTKLLGSPEAQLRYAPSSPVVPLDQTKSSDLHRASDSRSFCRKEAMVSIQEQRVSRCKGDAVLTSPIQTVPAPAALARSSTCCCSAALVTVARCPPSLSQLASASYQVAGASKKVNTCPSSLSET